MIYRYNDELMSYAQLYWEAEDENDRFFMELWEHMNHFHHFNPGITEEESNAEFNRKFNELETTYSHE